MAAREKNISETVRALVAPVCLELGYILWDVEFVKEGARKILRITIDAEGGVGIDDCEKLHRAVDPMLDEADPIDEAYFLEVSSPGIERELKSAEHFAYCEGETVEIKLYTPLDGSKVVRGKLLGLADGKIEIERDGAVIVLDRQKAAKVRTCFDF